MANEFRIPVRKFVEGLKGTRDEIWTKLLLLEYRQQAMTRAEWDEVMTALKGS